MQLNFTEVTQYAICESDAFDGTALSSFLANIGLIRLMQFDPSASTDVFAVRSLQRPAKNVFMFEYEIRKHVMHHYS